MPPNRTVSPPWPPLIVPSEPGQILLHASARQILRRAFDLIMDREKEFAELITRENGKAFSDAVGEVRYGAEFFRWFSEEAVRNRGEIYRSPAGDKKVIVINQPVGVSVLVTPWNFPIAMATRKIGPALCRWLHRGASSRHQTRRWWHWPWPMRSRKRGVRPVW